MWRNDWAIALGGLRPTGIFYKHCGKCITGTGELRGNDITPYWRTLKKDGELNEKYPGGIDQHKMLLEIEGHEVTKKGKHYFVKDYEKALFRL